MIRNQKGFGLVGMFLLVVVVVVVGYGGWYVWDARQNNTPTSSDSNQSASNANGASPAPSSPLSVEKTTYSKVPKALQDAILTVYQDKASNCVKDSVIVDTSGSPTDIAVTYASDMFAEANIGCESGAATLFAKVNGNWKVLSSTQFGFNCGTLRQYKVPVALIDAVVPGDAGATCIDDDKGEETPYVLD